MTMKELEEFFKKQFEVNMAAERTRLEADLKAKGLAAEAITAEVEKALKPKELEEGQKSKLRAEMMEQFEIAAAASSSIGLKAPEPHQIIGQMIVSGLKAMIEKNVTNVKNVPKDFILDVAKRAFPDSKALHGMMQKELTAGLPSAGGFTIPQIMLPDYIKFLYNATILDKLGITRVPMPNGNFSLPRMDATSAVGWVGEIQAIADTQPVFDAVNLRSKKLKAMTAISNSLLRQNVVGLDAWVSQDLQTVSRIALDTAFLYGAGTDFTPRGLKNIPGIQVDPNGGTSVAYAKETPINMIALLEQANVPMNNVAWIFSPVGKSWILQQAFASGPWAWADEMLRNKTLNGYPFFSSSTVQANLSASPAYSDFWVADFSLALWGVSYDISLELSREGTFVSGGQTISAFDQDLTLIRIIAEHDFSMRQPMAAVYAQYAK